MNEDDKRQGSVRQAVGSWSSSRVASGVATWSRVGVAGVVRLPYN